MELFTAQGPWTLLLRVAVGVGVTILTSLLGWLVTRATVPKPGRQRAPLAPRGNGVIVLACGAETPSFAADSPVRARAEKSSPDAVITWVHCDNFGQQIKATDSLIGLHSRAEVGALVVLAPLSLFDPMCADNPTLGQEFVSSWLRQLGWCLRKDVPCFGLVTGASPGDPPVRLLVLHPSRGWGLVPPEFRLFDADSDAPVPDCAAALLHALGLPVMAATDDKMSLMKTAEPKKER
jgi:hypothetical protein